MAEDVTINDPGTSGSAARKVSSAADYIVASVSNNDERSGLGTFRKDLDRSAERYSKSATYLYVRRSAGRTETGRIALVESGRSRLRLASYQRRARRNGT